MLLMGRRGRAGGRIHGKPQEFIILALLSWMWVYEFTIIIIIISHIRYVFTDKIFLISKRKYPYSGNHEDGVWAPDSKERNWKRGTHYEAVTSL